MQAFERIKGQCQSDNHMFQGEDDAVQQRRLPADTLLWHTLAILSAIYYYEIFLFTFDGSKPL